MAIVLSRRWKKQPPFAAALDFGSFFKHGEVTEVICPSMGLRYGAKTKKTDYALGSVPPTQRYGQQGLGASFTGASVNSYIELASDADSILSLTTATILILRSLTSTTFASGGQYGFVNAGIDRAHVHLPYLDNTIHFDWGGTSGGAGRLSVAQTWAVGTVDAFALVAGPMKGREIWRNGRRIANNASDTTARLETSAPYRVGAAGGIAGLANHEVLYQFALLPIELDDGRIRAWSENPWQIFKQVNERMYFDAPAAAGGVTYPQLERGTRGVNRGVVIGNYH